MTKLDALLERYGANAEERKKAAKANFDEALKAIFTEIPSVNLIVIKGYTPGFNDGDPCTHGQMVAVDVFDPDGIHTDLLEESEECLDEDDLKTLNLLSGRETFNWHSDRWDSQKQAYIPNPLPKDSAKTNMIQAVQLLDALEDDISTIYDTNFVLTITRDGDSYSISQTDYDCGW